MVTKKICDRCNTEIPEESVSFKYRIYYIGLSIKGKRVINKTKDICRKCHYNFWGDGTDEQINNRCKENE